MSDRPDIDSALELTESIRKLSQPKDPLDDAFVDHGDSVLLLCRDTDSRRWGPRWLTRVGLTPEVPAEPQNGLELVRQLRPSVIIVEAGLRAPTGGHLYTELANAADIEAPILVMCANNKEVLAAQDFDVHDLVRKPFEWQLISRRAIAAVRIRRLGYKLIESQQALEHALSVAESARKRLRSHQSFEPLTGLPNKRKYMELLRRAMAGADRDGSELAVLVIGFTRFRLVIEAMGQEQADEVLSTIGATLGECLRVSDAPGLRRPGLRTAATGILDQFRFAIMVTCTDVDDELSGLTQRLLDALADPISIGSQTVRLSACIGVAIYPQDADDADSLVQRADNAMRDAQSRGGGFKYYCSETDAAAVRKLRVEHMLDEALDRRELSLVFQPINDVETGSIVAAEALLRWYGEDGSQIVPDEFIPIAEESGQIIRVGEYVLDEACRQLKAWRETGMALPHICVNVAKAQLVSSGFCATVAETLKAHDLHPSSLELEISERGVLAGDHEIIGQLHELKSLGVRLSVDDFGTGDSAIAYLKELPVDVLKIDRSYIRGIVNDRKDSAIASAMIALGQRLDLLVVAEGVECTDQLKQLRDLGCDAFQGFLVSRPVPGDAFEKFLIL
ncbi:MAG: bifunctional diguanylate cyclase/phosphodiesterase [Woeseiaceae bacterium]|nr:bifunctional diguanylate cyclase/phosphodiesterase [Woeseiaceae bacterium]